LLGPGNVPRGTSRPFLVFPACTAKNHIMANLDIGFNIHVKLPPELMAQLEAIWWDGFWRGVVSAAIVAGVLGFLSLARRKT
jgi:hypothetical protein